MSRDDWFVIKEWDAATEAHFNEKLRRTRDKAQPLRIQASYLVNTDPKAALALLDRYFSLGDYFESRRPFWIRPKRTSLWEHKKKRSDHWKTHCNANASFRTSRLSRGAATPYLLLRKG